MPVKWEAAFQLITQFSNCKHAPQVSKLTKNTTSAISIPATSLLSLHPNFFDLQFHPWEHKTQKPYTKLAISSITQLHELQAKKIGNRTLFLRQGRRNKENSVRRSATKRLPMTHASLEGGLWGILKEIHRRFHPRTSIWGHNQSFWRVPMFLHQIAISDLELTSFPLRPQFRTPCRRNNVSKCL